MFEQQPLTYASDRTKTAFIMSLLSDEAADWAVANSMNRPTLALSYPDFVCKMRRVFDSVCFKFPHSRGGEWVG